jgi:ribonuclease HI
MTDTDVKSFRPISLTSFFLKTMERLLMWRLRECELATFPISSNQFAFHPGRTTEHALHRVTSQVEDALLSQKFALALFIDIEGAFDNVRFDSFEASLLLKGVRPSVVRWIDFMIRNRTVSACLADAHEERKVCRGGAQGGVLTPILWNLVIDELLKNQHPSGVNRVGYADDVTGVASGPDARTLQNLIQQFAAQAERWADSHGLRLSADKTVSVLFTRRRKPEKIPAIKIYGRDIPYVTETRYLGVTLTSGLRWSAHVRNIVCRAKRCLAQARRAIGPTWGLSPKVSMWIYTAVIRPIIMYASFIWIGALDLKTVRHQLHQLQGQTCRAITGAYPSTPFSGMNATLALPPLHLFLRSEAMKSCLRLDRGNSLRKTLSGYKSQKSLTPHLDFVLKDLRSVQIEPGVKSDAITPVLRLRRGFHIIIPRRSDIPVDFGLHPNHQGVFCFTDGSLKDGKTGAGLIVVSKGRLLLQEAIGLSENTSVYQAEVFAIEAAARHLTAAGVTDCKIVICSDSQAALKALDSPSIKSCSVLNCFQALQEISVANSVQLTWVPGHSDIVGNEIVDSLAKQGTTQSSRRTICPPISHLHHEINVWLGRQHQTQWDKDELGRQTHLALPVIDGNLSRILLNMRRSDLRSVTMAITGHGFLKRHQALQTGDSPICPRCDMGEETAEHHMIFCPFFSQIRQRHIGHCNQLRDLVKPDSVRDLLRFLKDAEVQVAMLDKNSSESNLRL